MKPFTKQSITETLFQYGLDTRNIEVSEGPYEVTVYSQYPIPRVIQDEVRNMAPIPISVFFEVVDMSFYKEKTEKMNICSCFGPPSKSCAVHGGSY
jgi:hypothetical protein